MTDGRLRLRSRRRGATRIGTAVLASIVLAGCASTPAADPAMDGVSNGPSRHAPARLRVVDHHGGAFGALCMHAGSWIQVQGDRVHWLDPRTLARRGTWRGEHRVHDVLGRSATTILVAQDDGVREVERAGDGAVSVIETWDADDLGVTPRAFGTMGGAVIVFGTPRVNDGAGDGGVAVRLRDGRRVMTAADGVPAAIVECAPGTAAIVGRQVRRLADDRFLGSASWLVPLDDQPHLQLPDVDGDFAAFAFARNGERSTVGLMTDTIRELDRARWTVEHGAPVRAMTLAHGRLWVADDESLCAYLPVTGRLRRVARLPIAGVTALASIDDAQLAVASPTTLVRITYTPETGYDTSHTRRAVANVRASRSDRGVIFVETPTGTWRYDPERGTLAETDVRVGASSTATSGTVVGDRAVIAADGRTVEGGAWRWAPPAGGRVHVVRSIGGRLWVGHDHGVTVLEPHGATVRDLATWRAAGPVTALHATLAPGGAVYVGAELGLGTLELVEAARP